MKKGNKIASLACTAVVAGLAMSTAQAAWIMLTDFDDYNTGNLVGQDGWTGTGTNKTVIVDPTDANNQVASFAAGSQTEIYRSLGDQAIANNTTSTLFFRFYTTSTTPNISVAASTSATPSGSGTVANQLRVGGTTTASILDARNATGYENLATYATSTWYNMWVVIDNTADTQTYFLSTGTDAGTQIGSTMGFRNAANSSIQTLQLFTFSSGSGALLIDDIYITSGVNTSMIPEPASALLLGFGAFGFLLRRRRSRE